MAPGLLGREQRTAGLRPSGFLGKGDAMTTTRLGQCSHDSARSRDGRLGFTLIELSIAVSIIGILAAIAIPNFARARANAARGSCITNQRNLATSGILYAADLSLADAEFNVHDLLNAGRVPADLTECPESGTEDNDDYILTFEGGRLTAIECAIMGDDHLYQP
jgi:prepilin-type N-terminal cleavage/methylation domain-containing protein